MELNGGRGLGMLSEEGLETIHKLLRRYRETRARKTSLDDNLKDVFHLLLLRSDPRVRDMFPKLYCSRCKVHGHTVRKCTVGSAANPMTEEDQIVLSFFESDDDQDASGRRILIAQKERGVATRRARGQDDETIQQPDPDRAAQRRLCRHLLALCCGQVECEWLIELHRLQGGQLGVD